MLSQGRACAHVCTSTDLGVLHYMWVLQLEERTVGWLQEPQDRCYAGSQCHKAARHGTQL